MPRRARGATVVVMAQMQIALPLDAALADIISMLEQHRARMSGLLERLDRLRDAGDGATAVVFGRMCNVLHERDRALAALAADLAVDISTSDRPPNWLERSHHAHAFRPVP